MVIHVNGIDLFYEKSGSGPPIILLHGNGETHDIFDRAVPLLAEKFTVYSLDTRGHGQSGPISEFHYNDMAGDVKCFIEALCTVPPVLYGFSDGGIVGLLLASKHPTLLSQLIVSGANLYPEGIRGGWLRLFRFIYGRTGDAKMKMMLEEPDITQEMLQNIQIPVTVLAGGRDMVRRSHTKKIALLISGSSLKILPFHGHGSYIVHRKKIAELILQIYRQ